MTGRANGGIPGLTGVDHIGFTVPDLEVAHRFLVDVIGCEYLYELGPYVDPDGGWMQVQLGVDPRARMRNRWYRCGAQSLEVFQYDVPDQRAEPPRNSDVGGHHIALYVTDIEQAVSYLLEHDVEVMGDIVASSGPHLGQRWVYVRAPWGMQFELVSYPSGKAWMVGTRDPGPNPMSEPAG